jgi:hypothetical protein
MKFLIIHFPPSSCHFPSPRFKHSPSNSVLAYNCKGDIDRKWYSATLPYSRRLTFPVSEDSRTCKYVASILLFSPEAVYHVGPTVLWLLRKQMITGQWSNSKLTPYWQSEQLFRACIKLGAALAALLWRCWAAANKGRFPQPPLITWRTSATFYFMAFINVT